MGQAKQRGTFEQRKLMALTAEKKFRDTLLAGASPKTRNIHSQLGTRTMMRRLVMAGILTMPTWGEQNDK